MPAEKISLANAKQNKLFYFVANVVVYRESDCRCLILKRSQRETVHPGRYGVIGGKLEWNDFLANPGRLNGDVLDYPGAVESLLAREAREEAGVEIDTSRLLYVNSVAFVRPDETPVIMVKFAAPYKGGDVILEQDSFDDYAWVNADEIRNYQCIDGIADEVGFVLNSLNA